MLNLVSATRFLILLLSVPIVLRLQQPALALVLSYGMVAIFSKGKEGRLGILSTCLFGFLIPIAPLFGTGTLLILTVIFLASSGCSLVEGGLRWALPFLVIAFSSTMAVTLLSFDMQTILGVWNGLNGPTDGGLSDLSHWLAGSPPPYLRTLEQFLRLTVFVLLFDHLKQSSILRKQIITAICFGLIPSICIGLAQLYTGLEWLIVNQTPFWTAQGRICSTFTDPNAFGIFAALVLPVLYGTYRISHLKTLRAVCLVGGIGTIPLALYSGSRTYLIAIFLYLVLYAYSKKPAYVAIPIAFGIVLVATLNTLYLLSPETINFILDLSPVGGDRVFNTLLLQSMPEGLFSRMVFLQIAASVWSDYPIFGVGLGMFHHFVQDYSAGLELGIGLWTDNANNFYLAVLTETGLVGFLAMLWSLRQLRWNSEPTYRAGVICLGVLLIFGPHLDFDEIAVLSAVLFAATLEVKNNLADRSGYLAIALVVIASLGVFLFPIGGGLYAWEKGERGYFRWTGRKAVSIAACDENSQASIVVRAAHPDIGTKPVEVLLSSSGMKLAIIKDYEPQRILFECEAPGEYVSYELRVSRTWTPRSYGFGDDSRVLGVQLFGMPGESHKSSSFFK